MPADAAPGPEDHILFETRDVLGGALGLVTLNRPKQLNALTQDMIRRLHAQLVAWRDAPEVKLVALRGAGGKALSAGGDIRRLYDNQAQPELNDAFYWDEYRLNQLIKRFPKPYIAFMDGVVMGGGVGVSLHGAYTVVGDATLFAMPETGIGFFPDVGATYFLPRLPRRIGFYAGLTGARFGAGDVMAAHLADYYVRSERQSAALEALSAADYSEHVDEVICEALAVNAAPPPVAPLKDHFEELEEIFLAETLDGLLSALEQGGDWAQATLATLRSKSPTAIAFTFEMLTRGLELEFEDCMRMEFRAARHFMRHPDFYEGVRAVIVDKDQAPRWTPAQIAEVSQADIAAALEPTGADELSFE